jgi:hypothetical protein
MGGACSTYGGKVYTGFWWGNTRERDHLEDQDVDGRIILKRVFKKSDEGHGTELIWLRTGHVVGCCKCGNEPSVSIKCGAFLTS